MCRSTILFMNLREERRQQSVTAHAEEYTALAKKCHHNHRAIAKQNGNDDGTVQPWISRSNDASGISRSHVVDSYGNRGNTLLTGKIGVVCHTCHYMCKEDVKYGTNQQRHQDTDRHVAFRVLGFLGSCTYGIESQEGKEYHGCSTEYTAKAELTQSAGIGWNVWSIVLCIDELPSQCHKNQDNGYLEEYNDVVHQRAFLRTTY